MKVTVNFHNHQLKDGAQEGAPKVDQVPDTFCISHSVESCTSWLILKPPSFLPIETEATSTLSFAEVPTGISFTKF